MNKTINNNAPTEVSASDILICLGHRWKLIAAAGIVGMISAFVYASAAPKLYEAIWQIKMAQGSSNSSLFNSEEPTALIRRLRLPTVYTKSTLLSCGLGNDSLAGELLAGTLKVQEVKNVSLVLEFRYRATDPLLAKVCAEAVFEMIAQQQLELIHDRLAGRKQQAAEYEQALFKEQQELDRPRRADLSNVGYLIRLDKLTWLRGRIDQIQEELFLSEMHPSKLVAPISVSASPVSPRVPLLLLLGGVIGLFAGILYALWRHDWRKLLVGNVD